jgi:hypothetical protein
MQTEMSETTPPEMKALLPMRGSEIVNDETVELLVRQALVSG